MTDHPRGRPEPDTRGDVDPDVAELLGLRPAGADSMPDSSELDDLGEMTDTAVYEGELTSRQPGSDQPDQLQLESLAADEARAGETDNADEAAEEGLAWIPPTDPPTRPDPNGFGPEVAAGFGTTAEDEPFDADHHGELLYAADERTERVEEALRADARTSGFADRIDVDTEDGRVILDGRVDDLDDEDAAIAVAEEVSGVAEVVSRLSIGVLEPDPSR
ncbi:MAG TPA: BON domain-containing protein [Candidatus Limnocylindrales bacterium]|nr:BON domain-containing protein [Candidatus Limnocylindrales bacterium]